MKKTKEKTDHLLFSVEMLYKSEKLLKLNNKNEGENQMLIYGLEQAPD